jgi:hypothetical protein
MIMSATTDLLGRSLGWVLVVGVIGTAIELTHPSCETREFVSKLDYFGVMGTCPQPAVPVNRHDAPSLTTPRAE